MVPKFTSQSDMLGFVRALPVNAAYEKMLRDDFNITAPEDAEAWQKEYLWKFLVQGQYMGKEGDELVQYAATTAENFISKNPFILQNERFQSPKQVVAGQHKVLAGSTKKVHFENVDGAVVFLEHRQVWVGYFGGKIVGTKKTKEKMEEFMRTKYSLLDSSI